MTPSTVDRFGEPPGCETACGQVDRRGWQHHRCAQSICRDPRWRHVIWRRAGDRAWSNERIRSDQMKSSDPISTVRGVHACHTEKSFWAVFGAAPMRVFAGRCGVNLVDTEPSVTSALPPKSGHRRVTTACPFCVISRHRAASFNHLVGGSKQYIRHVKAERLGGL
jgi:hypothetical protein